MKIRIEKLEVVSSGVPAANESEHIPGRANFHGKSLPVSYWIEGELLSPESNIITIGLPVYVRRHTRNGIIIDGYFKTTPVRKVTPEIFETENSVYKYTFYI
jgi:hypothetical protein